MDKTPLVKWINQNLTEILECEVGDEYCKSILGMNKSEIGALINGLIDTRVPRNKQFLDELLIRLSAPSSIETKDFKIYKKPDLEPEHKSKNKKLASEPETESSLRKQLQNRKQAPISIFGTEAQASNDFKLPGRRMCDCEASKHKLVANCLKCGRIVCEQEGSGPCLFCENLVCTRQELEKINSGSKKGEVLKQQLLSKTWDEEGLKRAMEHKNKLIEYDRNSAKRTQVIDDEADYFQSGNKWLNKNQRDKLSKMQTEVDSKRFASKLQSKTYALDLTGKRIVENFDTVDFDKLAMDVETIESESTQPISVNTRIANQNIQMTAPVFIPEKSTAKKSGPKKENEKPSGKIRIQDRELQEMKDDGMCLTMHQPWASLLVLGIKKHEGRTWYTPYRGRLWIHAASKQPTEEDIASVEEFYKKYYSSEQIDLPTSYPTSCLLGYVDLIDCVAEDSYKEQYPNGESESPYVFICEDPYELVVKVPMSGQHKIFKLDRAIFAIARKTAVSAR